MSNYEPVDENQPLNTDSQLKVKEYPEPSKDTFSTFSTLIKLAIIVFVAIILFEMTDKLFTIQVKQQQMKALASHYIDALVKLDQQMIELESKAESAKGLTSEQKHQYAKLKKQIKKLQMQMKAKGDLPKQIQTSEVENTNTQQNSVDQNKVAALENLLSERRVFINFLLSNSKQIVRQNKIKMFDKIAAKSEFKQQKIRNPWAMARLNLKTPFVDTLQKRKMEQQMMKQSDRIQKDYKVSIFPQFPICVIVPTYNNAKNYRFEYNLQSIMNQDYDNFKVIVVDDASTDGTNNLIQHFLSEHETFATKVTLVQNQKQMKAVHNINYAIRTHCSQDSISIIVSGDDQILGMKVFKLINAVYHSKKPGVAYTNHFFGKLHENDFDKGYSSSYNMIEMKNQNFRFIGQKFGHMRTFKTELFLKIKEQHMKSRDGNWLQATWDETFHIPLLEMSCDSIQYIDEYVYNYNYGTGQNDGQIHHDTQAEAAMYVRQLPRYSCIEKYKRFKI